jgi:hypothetical protein
MLLMLEQEVVHRPEATLPTRTLGRFRGAQRVRMDFLQREMAKCESDTLVEAPEHQIDGARRLLAMRTFEIPVFHDRDGRVIRPEHVIHRPDWVNEIEGLRVHYRVSVDAALGKHQPFFASSDRSIGMRRSATPVAA